MAMGHRKQVRQEALFVTAVALPQAPRHVFHERLNRILAARKFDKFVEDSCRSFHADKNGRPGLAPGTPSTAPALPTNVDTSVLARLPHRLVYDRAADSDPLRRRRKERITEVGMLGVLALRMGHRTGLSTSQGPEETTDAGRTKAESLQASVASGTHRRLDPKRPTHPRPPRVLLCQLPRICAGRLYDHDASQAVPCKPIRLFTCCIGFDAACGKLHKFVTLVVNLDTRAVVSVAPGRGQAGLLGFFLRLKSAAAKVQVVAKQKAPSSQLVSFQSPFAGIVSALRDSIFMARPRPDGSYLSDLRQRICQTRPRKPDKIM